MLLFIIDSTALILEFESRRGDIILYIIANLFARMKKGISCWERLAWVGAIRRESTREEIVKGLSLLVTKIQGTYRSGEGGERACYVNLDFE